MAKKGKKQAEPKSLELVCKCGDCSHWKIVLNVAPRSGQFISGQFIKCMSCGLEIECYFSIEAHEGIHYERFDSKK